jgi:hypothetical protein
MRVRLSALLVVLATSFAMAQDTQPEAPADPKPEAPAAQQAEAPMTAERLIKIAFEIDPNANLVNNTVELVIEDIPILLILAPTADRMRAMVPISSADGLTKEDLLRLSQANFDSALDARYAVAQGRLWSAFIHPLSPLERDQFLSGLVQTINLARTYGQTYTGGASVFGGGDSNGIFQKLFEELQEKGEAL